MGNTQIVKPEYSDLPFSDEFILQLTERTCRTAIENVPGLRYYDMPETRKMNRPDNICGHQQRAWEFYWAIRASFENCGKPLLGIGTGSIQAPFMLTTDKYCGESPDSSRYGINGYSAMRLDADNVPYSFYDGAFSAVIANHAFEHLKFQKEALFEWFRLTCSGGYICILMPDMNYMERGTIDPTHTREFDSDEFYKFAEVELALPPHVVVEHNTLDNAFSFNTVFRKL